MARTREAAIRNAACGRHAPPRRAASVLLALDIVFGLGGIAAILLIVPRFYLSIYPRDGYTAPVGFDTATYVWRSDVVIAGGLNALPDSSPFPFDSNKSNPDRAGLPVLAAITRATTGVDPWRLAFVLPAVCATTIALAAGAAGVGGTGEPRWSFAIYGIALGLAAPVALTANGYLDNLVVDGTLVAAAAATLAAADGQPTVAGAVLLIAASFTIHWMFASLFTGILVGFALLLVPASILARRRGTPLSRTPTARVGAVAVLGGGLGVGAMLLISGFQSYTTRDHAGFQKKLDVWLPYYRLTRTAPAAAVGALGLGVSGDGRRLRAVGLWLAWLLPCAAALLAFHLGLTMPIQRIVGFGLPLWLLAAAGGTWLIRATWRWLSRVSPWLGAVAVLPAVAVVAASLLFGYRMAGTAWEHARPVVVAPLVASIRAAGPYLESLPADAPIVVPVDTPTSGTDFGLIPAFAQLRALVPADRASHVYVYLGDPANLLARRPTLKPDVATYDAVSNKYWNALAPVLLGSQQVVLAVAPYTPSTALLAQQRPDRVVAPGVVVIHGPKPASMAPASPPLPPKLDALVADTVRVLLLLTLVGLGWSVGLVRTELLSRLALAPAVGQAALVAAGLLAGRVGTALDGSSAVRLAVAVGAAGWIWALGSFGVRRVLARRRRGTLGTVEEVSLAEAALAED